MKLQYLYCEDCERERRISEIANKIWQRLGEPVGEDEHIWAEAEAEYDLEQQWLQMPRFDYVQNYLPRTF